MKPLLILVMAFASLSLHASDEPVTNIETLIREIHVITDQPHHSVCEDALQVQNLNERFTLFRLGSPSSIIEAIHRYMATLKDNGTLTIHDFVLPDGPSRVVLSLDRQSADTFPFDPRSVEIEPQGEARRFVTDLDIALEFLHSHRTFGHLPPPFLQFTQDRWEKIFHSIGVRVPVSRRLSQPKTVSSFDSGNLQLHNLGGGALDLPYGILLVAQKVDRRSGLEIRMETSEDIDDSSSIKSIFFRDKETGVVEELIGRSRPRSLAVLPYFIKGGQLFILSHRDSPRPLLSIQHGHLQGAKMAGYMPSPMLLPLDSEKNLGRSVASMFNVEVSSTKLGPKHYPDPTSFFDQTQLMFVNLKKTIGENSGDEKYLEAKEVSELLSSLHTTGLSEMNLEIAIYRLLQFTGQSAEPWTVKDVSLQESLINLSQLKQAPLKLMPRKIWRKLGWFKRKPRSFWQLKEGTFQEILSSGLKQDPVRMEYIMPKSYGMNMISMLPVVKIDGVVWVGLVPQGSPAAQLDREPGKQWGLPKEHVPKTLSSLDEALAFVHQRFEESYGIRITTLIPLGADYRTNPELTPEVVYPFVADVSELMLQSPLTWFSLEDLMRSQDKLLDGHLLLSLFRLNHAVAGR